MKFALFYNLMEDYSCVTDGFILLVFITLEGILWNIGFFHFILKEIIWRKQISQDVFLDVKP
jgi:cellulose synthase/poly-beta-1,6-N-acetylglucosamine synthase-like glycosyltransferase